MKPERVELTGEMFSSEEEKRRATAQQQCSVDVVLSSSAWRLEPETEFKRLRAAISTLGEGASTEPLLNVVALKVGQLR